MASNFMMRVQLKGVAETVQKARTLSHAESIVGDAIRHLTAVGEAAAKLNSPRDLGGMQRDIVSEVKALEGRVYVTGKSHGVKGNVIEFGRGAGKKAPPISALAGWASRHGFGTDKQTLFLLARGIARRGKKGRFMFRKARTAVRRQAKLATDKMAQRALAIWGS